MHPILLITEGPTYRQPMAQMTDCLAQWSCTSSNCARITTFCSNVLIEAIVLPPYHTANRCMLWLSTCRKSFSLWPTKLWIYRHFCRSICIRSLQPPIDNLLNVHLQHRKSTIKATTPLNQSAVCQSSPSLQAECAAKISVENFTWRI